MRHRPLLLLCVCVAAGAADARTTILPATLPAAVRPGEPFPITWRFRADGPLASSETVFVHYLDAQGKMVSQGDHGPLVDTGSADWTGEIAYRRTAGVPADLPDGRYTVVAGLYAQPGRAHLEAGDGVKDLGGDAYDVGTLVVDHAAPSAPRDTEGKKTLDLSGYSLAFDEDFSKPLDVSAWGPGTRWIAHTPWNGDFGDAAFADPEPGFPFTIDHGVLRIEARKDPAFAEKDAYHRPWRAGLIASNDRSGAGFSLKYGYFEMRAKLPKGPGVWPAFWLCSSYDRTKADAGKDGAIEIDVLEYYGDESGSYMATVHTWEPQPHRAIGNQISTRRSELCEGFHDIGALVDPAWITMYVDGVQVWRTRTPKAHTKPLMLLANLALGGGWPIDRVANPSVMEIEHLRAYAPK